MQRTRINKTIIPVHSAWSFDLVTSNFISALYGLNCADLIQPIVNTGASFVAILS